jgi:hypothetical protein
MSTALHSEPLSKTELGILRLLVFVHPATLNTEYLRHRLGLHVGPRHEADSLVGRGLIEQVEAAPDRLEEWRATHAGIVREAEVSNEHPLPDRIALGRFRPRPFDHLCPPSRE